MAIKAKMSLVPGDADVSKHRIPKVPKHGVIAFVTSIRV